LKKENTAGDLMEIVNKISYKKKLTLIEIGTSIGTKAMLKAIDFN
jgi:hypothetical protein